MMNERRTEIAGPVLFGWVSITFIQRDDTPDFTGLWFRSRPIRQNAGRVDFS
jgi:hypothetical protein